MKTIGRYEITGRLGRGGMSGVYKARAPLTGRIVAVKVLQPRDELFADLAGRDRLREIFWEEARIMGGISHPHIAEVVDCDEENGMPFIVLEYFPHSLGALIGESYRVERPSRTVSAARTAHYVLQALKGLERLHFAGIVHRDIKPFNLMITSDDRIKIIDFGLSRVRGEEKMTIPGLQVGSPYYAAPEQEVRPEAADDRADLYSLGVLLYRMLTGRLPERAGGKIEPPSRYRPDLNWAWDQFILKSLAARPEERFPSAKQMRRVFEDVYADWERQAETGCLSGEDLPQDDGERVAVRAEPGRIAYRDAARELGLDALMRPLVYSRQHPELLDAFHVEDPRTGLVWQTGGSEYTLDWRQAGEYVEYLNRRRWLGRDTWRLPTVAELLTLLQPPTVTRDFCLHSAFPKDIHWLWSGDDCTPRQAWMVDIVECYVDKLDKDGAASVCAVSSANP